PPFVRKWRNWQTRKPQELVAARSWRFKSSLPHQHTKVPAVSTQPDSPLLSGNCPVRRIVATRARSGGRLGRSECPADFIPLGAQDAVEGLTTMVEGSNGVRTTVKSPSTTRHVANHGSPCISQAEVIGRTTEAPLDSNGMGAGGRSLQKPTPSTPPAIQPRRFPVTRARAIPRRTRTSGNIAPPGVSPTVPQRTQAHSRRCPP